MIASRYHLGRHVLENYEKQQLNLWSAIFKEQLDRLSYQPVIS